jgi:uncharacterized protein involved in exopolysaccharide biosynthesis
MTTGYPKKTLRELAVVIFSRWFAILAITVIITGATLLASLSAKKVYRSEVTLWARQAKLMNVMEETPDPMSRLEVFLKTQQKIILSDTVLRRTLVRLEDSDLLREPDNSMDSPDLAGTESAAWKQWYDKISEKAKTIHGKEVAQFSKKVSVTTPGGEDVAKSEVFTISVDQPSPPERAQLTAEVLTQEYLIHRRKLQVQFDDSSKELLERQLKDLRDKTLGMAETKLNEFIEQNVKGNLLDLTQLQQAGGEVNHQRLRTAFQEEQVKVDMEIGEYKALRAEVVAQIPEKAMKEGADSLTKKDIESCQLVIPEKVLANNTIITKLKKQLADIIIKRNTLRERYNGDYAPLKQNEGEILSTTRDIIKELQGEVKAIDQHINTLQARRTEIQTQIADKDKIIDSLSTMAVTYNSLTQEVDLSRKLYEKKRKDLLDTETARQMSQCEVMVTPVDKATLPDVDRPVRPILWLYTAIALVTGLLLGIAYAFLADSYDHSVGSIDQAERYFGKQVLVTVPDVSGGIVRR